MMKHKYLIGLFFVFLFSSCVEQETVLEATEEGDNTILDDGSSTKPGAGSSPGSNSNGPLVGTIAHLNTIEIHAPANIDFGDKGPTLVFRTDLNGSIVGQAFDTTDYEGVATINTNGEGAPLIEANSELPYGKGFVIGSLQNHVTNPNSSQYRQIRGFYTNDPTKKTYEHNVVYYPPGNQANASPLLNTSSTWQVKTFWNMEGFNFRDDGINMFTLHIPGYYGSGNYFLKCGMTLSSNSLKSIYGNCPNGNDYTTFANNNNAAMMRDTPLIIQAGYDLGTSMNSQDGKIMWKVTDTQRGKFADNTQTGISFAPHIDKTVDWSNRFYVDSFSYPGFVRGFNLSANAHYLSGDFYKTSGDGAWARVEICEDSDYNQCKKISPFTVLSWENSKISAKVYEGFFYNKESLEGKWIHIHNSDWIHVYKFQVTSEMI